MNALERHINGLFGDTRVLSARLEKGFIRVPTAELQDTDDAIHLKLELLGLETKDLDIQVTQDAVHISGERKSQTQTENNGTTKSEFYYGKFKRVIPLSARIQNTNVTADYKDGILNLTLPKTEQEKNKVVKLNLEQPAA
ncbi:Hsp20/alpha crystallin family protein [Nostoc favosum]|uniref:Hsp20/alpha crystallin family protein n=1 Tax=Nostoc favosum CHAB5714 TaxID=2780399 RepID=A0ABS8IAJ0_9NOSO|nr:Hsp20/alpha crystallin family protein [Nostoc favosum]MCC5600871.1 Hsp20/alpha crystallin family protein [Nostoc favosum CHAB5714]